MITVVRIGGIDVATLRNKHIHIYLLDVIK